ncbi:hypothetical protein [Christiangramia sp. SM2212]|uniref:Outer membrane protein beta-barrel domain-containing protein n=1 Tax=Christiangramia sediminicola TaxID=3073267 RepID=A0ABU1ES56_9FLAO|nr:hypothetical protein [Christiangramia sp. SM2212]MDR5591221.1 hypothetical protein [Christiangramia sp. SM2212]
MFRKLLISSILLLSIQSNAQRWGDFEIGPMVNFEYTSLIVSSGQKSINNQGRIEEDWNATGYESNFSAGLYTMFFIQERVGVGAELYYDKTTSTDFGEENYYTSVTFLPFVNINFIESIPGLYFGAGGGISLIQDSPDYMDLFEEEEIQDIALIGKLSATYRFRNIITIETGIHGDVLEVVKDRVKRNSFFLGVKIPLNRILIDYRY